MTLTHGDDPLPPGGGVDTDPTDRLQLRPGHLQDDRAPGRRRRVDLPAGATPRRAQLRRLRVRRLALERARRRRRVSMAGWRLLVVVGGASTLVVCSAMALGIVTVGRDGLGLDLPGMGGGRSGPATVHGADGLYPGGPPVGVELTVRNPGATAFEIGALLPDLSGLPAACPAAAWRVDSPGQLPTVPARAEATVGLPIALLAGAPDGCQGLSVTLPVRVQGLQQVGPAAGGADGSGPAGSTGTGPAGPLASTSPGAGTPQPASTTASVAVTVAALGSPSAVAGVRGGDVAVRPARPDAGPAPDGYDVNLLADDGSRSPLCSRTAGECLDAAVPPAARRRYLVTARLGEHWARESAPVEAWTPAPAPQLAFADGAGPAASAVRLVARGAGHGYDVELLLDAATRPFASVHVPAGTDTDRTLSVPRWGTGRHRIVAVSTFHGWRAPSATLRVTVSSQGVATPAAAEPAAPAAPADLPPSSTPADPTAGPPQPTLRPATPVGSRPAAPSTTHRVTVPSEPPAPSLPAEPPGPAPSPVAPGPVPPAPAGP